jgi:hypothetical protein
MKKEIKAVQAVRVLKVGQDKAVKVKVLNLPQLKARVGSASWSKATDWF